VGRGWSEPARDRDEGPGSCTVGWVRLVGWRVKGRREEGRRARGKGVFMFASEAARGDAQAPSPIGGAPNPAGRTPTRL